MNNYLIPANSKKSQLWFGIFRPIDLGIVGFGAILTLALMFIIPGDTLSILFVKLLPVGLCLLLVVPIPYYHNILVYIQEALLFLTGQKRYIWRGWCARYGYDDAKK